MSLSLEQQRRYARQIQLDGFGEAAQQKLLNARILVIGAGGLGAASISYLAAAGVGEIGIIDDDRVELSNLNRQILHETGDIGRRKVESASDRVHELNPEVRIHTYDEKLSATNAEKIIGGYDIVCDGCDNFETRFIVNEVCLRLKKPLISAAVRGFDGQLTSFAPHLAPSPCYRCFVSPDAPEANTCREAGIIGPLCGVVGSMQALEAIHCILGAPQLIGQVLLFDGHDFSQRKVTLPRDEDCPVCGIHRQVA